ncbi:MAG: alpha/beta hydrolase [Streptosporangiaceae bacterium]
MKVFRTAAVLVALTLSTACSTTGQPNGPQPPPSQGTEQIAWSDCKGKFQCGTLKVPVDYANPAGDQFTLALIRLPATGRRIGSLVTNPGGPGGSGIEFVRSTGNSFGKEIKQNFDIVGFDPRGVGKSDPIRCLSSGELDDFFAVDTSPDDATELDGIKSISKKFADGCRAKSAKLLPFVGTRNAARDIDAIRAAVGDEKLTYYGASYGTLLGAWYAEQFPQNVRALVLDGAVDPALTTSQTNIEQARGFETALRAFVADCAKATACPLGQNIDAGLTKISDLLTSVDRTPLTTLGTRRLDESLLALGIATPLYQRDAWPLLQQALKQALAGDGSTLLRFADLLVERGENGDYSNQSEANMAVNCVDKPSPDPAGFAKDAAAAKKAAPRFGPFIVWSTLPCAYWPAKPTEEARPLKAAGAAPIVVVGTTRDPATPYQWAKNLAAELDSGILLSLNGDGHTAYLSGPPCIRTAIDTYLLTTKAPQDGTTC